MERKIEGKIREVERKLKMKKKKEKRKCIVIKGLKVKEKKRKEKAEALEQCTEIKQEKVSTLEGDFNVKTRRIEIRERKERRKRKRRSEDKKIIKERKRLIEFVEEKDWSIFNENIKGDKEGKFTFVGEKGNSNRLCNWR